MSETIESEIDWGVYSEQYDRMCHHNDAYEENITHLLRFIETLGLEPNSHILDLGAGTGNFVSEIAQKHPEFQLFHLDSNREMNSIALQKYQSLELQNVQVIEEDVQRVQFGSNKFDLAICVNALYAMQPQELILSKIRDWIVPGGHLYVIDLGRKMNTLDWGLHFLRQAYKEKRLIEYVSDAAFRGHEVLRQNRITSVAQHTGRYWTHETASFGKTLEDAGFEVKVLETCYRDYADLAICRNPST